MRHAKYNICCAVLVFGHHVLLAQTPDQSRMGRDIGPQDLTLEARPVEPLPLPFQPVRFRAITRNVSSEKLFPHPIENLSFNVPILERKGQYYKDEVLTTRVREPGLNKNKWAPGDHVYIELRPKESVSICKAVTPIRVQLGFSTRPENFPEHCEFWVPGQYQLELNYPAGFDASSRRRVEFKTLVHLSIAEPQGADKSVADVLAKDPVLALCLCEAMAPPAPELVPKLLHLLTLYPKMNVQSGLANADGSPMLVEREICSDSSYAYFIHFALARYYLKGDHQQRGTPRSHFLAAREIDHVIDGAFAYHPNALVLAMSKSDLGSLPPTVWTEARLHQMRRMLIEHYSDTDEFLGRWYSIFFNEDLEWMPNHPPGSNENWYKFRRTIPKPYPLPAIVETKGPNALAAAPPTIEAESARHWRGITLIAIMLAVGLVAITSALVYSISLRQRRNGGQKLAANSTEEAGRTTGHS